MDPHAAGGGVVKQDMWVDRGRQLRLNPAAAASPGSRCLALSRLAGASVAPGCFSAWIQLHGDAWIEAREGRFELLAGDWIMFERDSAPDVQVDGRGLCMAVVLDTAALDSLERLNGRTLFPGLGRLPPGGRATALRLWREADDGRDVRALRPLLVFLEEMELDLAERESACPGRSRGHKRQVFARMQRARMFLEGHCDRVVRVEELARMANFSSWYFSKAFHALYGESPQAYAARLRLERAARLLRSTSLTVGEVAAASGFDNSCSFARAFRARYGMPASRFRGMQSLRTGLANPEGAGGKAEARGRAYRLRGV